MVWGKILEKLDDYEQRRVEFVFTPSPQEEITSGEPRRRPKKSAKATVIAKDLLDVTSNRSSSLFTQWPHRKWSLPTTRLEIDCSSALPDRTPITRRKT